MRPPVDDILQGDDEKKDTDHARDNDRLDGGADTDTVRGGGGTDTMLDDASEVDENFAYWASGWMRCRGTAAPAFNSPAVLGA